MSFLMFVITSLVYSIAFNVLKMNSYYYLIKLVTKELPSGYSYLFISYITFLNDFIEFIAILLHLPA
jgi:hypothetical protein